MKLLITERNTKRTRVVCPFSENGAPLRTTVTCSAGPHHAERVAMGAEHVHHPSNRLLQLLSGLYSTPGLGLPALHDLSLESDSTLGQG